jgi:hypothetical protein
LKIIIQAASFVALQTIYIYRRMYITKTIQLIEQQQQQQQQQQSLLVPSKLG